MEEPGCGTGLRRGRTWGAFKHVCTAGSWGSAPPCTCAPGKAAVPLGVLSLRVEAGVVLPHQLPSATAVGHARGAVTPLLFRPATQSVAGSLLLGSALVALRHEEPASLSCPHLPIEFSALGFSNCLQLLEKLLLSFSHPSVPLPIPVSLSHSQNNSPSFMSQGNITSSRKPSLTDTPILGALGFGQVHCSYTSETSHHTRLSSSLVYKRLGSHRCMCHFHWALKLSLGMKVRPEFEMQLNHFLIVGLGLNFKPVFHL